jgi:hypothetical protein
VRDRLGKELEMKLAFLVAVLATAGLVALASARTGSEAFAASDVRLSVGDTVRVDEAPVGCRVTRLARYGNRVFLDCRRGGRLAGTYGTYFGEKDVLVVRFVGPRKAKVVLRAQHVGEATRCR